MEIEITNGKGIIDIQSDGHMDCLIINTPYCVERYDYGGTTGKYVDFINIEERFTYTQALNDALTFGDEEKILESIKDFLQWFSNGSYSVYFYKEAINHDNIEYATKTDPITHKGAHWYYHFQHSVHVFTQSYDIISKERVQYYKDLIEKGMRPKIIAISSVKDWRLSYILDGHHKLLAYLATGIEAEFIDITKHTTDEENKKNEGILVVECEHLFSKEDIIWIIKNNPAALFGDSENEKKYNQYFDDYLASEKTRISADIFMILFKYAASEKESEQNWLYKRLEVIKNKEISEKMYFYFQKDYSWYPYPVFSKNDIEQYIRKYFPDFPF